MFLYFRRVQQRLEFKYGVPGIRILEWPECDRGVTILAVQILIAEGKHGKVKIIAQSSYGTIVQRISGI
jgi:hypothetical protein